MSGNPHTDPAVSPLRAAARHVSAQSLPEANPEAATLDWSRKASEGSKEEVLARIGTCSSTSSGCTTRLAGRAGPRPLRERRPPGRRRVEVPRYPRPAHLHVPQD
ncbi:hypothetical protein ACVNF4_01535 [Streptomyces sp. S6]